MATTEPTGLDSLSRLAATDPPQWLTPNPSLSATTRAASQHIFASLKPFAPKCPFDRLLIDGFDAEQIWQQIDLQSKPLISGLKRELNKLEKNSTEISSFFGEIEGKRDGEIEKADGLDGKFDGSDEEFDAMDEEEEEEEEEGESGSEDGEEEEEKKGGVEDGFLKINELEEFLEEDEAREYGLKPSKKKTEKGDDDERSEEDEDEDDDEEEELGMFGEGDDDDEEVEELDYARYEDFFLSDKKDKKRKSKTLTEESEDDSEMDDEEDDYENEDNLSTQEKELKELHSKVNQMEKADVSKGNLSTHEKELEKLRAKIKQMEQEMLEPKPWLLQGEVTAAQRPKNSALEIDLDFEHNIRPPPVITEEVKVSLEEMIKKRIVEGQFDDVQRPLTLPTKAPRERKELDENKSNKGLAELYEEEYVQKTNPAFKPVSFSDELKKEADELFKKLCLKLDALSHFHFTPKPVIEDMSIQANVPALAMEEIAPVAVSDAAMLAPEEVFSGKGDIKEEAELTKEERKRRRARKKRKFKAESAKRMIKKIENKAVVDPDTGKD